MGTQLFPSLLIYKVYCHQPALLKVGMGATLDQQIQLNVDQVCSQVCFIIGAAVKSGLQGA